MPNPHQYYVSIHIQNFPIHFNATRDRFRSIFFSRLRNIRNMDISSTTHVSHRNKPYPTISNADNPSLHYSFVDCQVIAQIYYFHSRRQLWRYWLLTNLFIRIIIFLSFVLFFYKVLIRVSCHNYSYSSPNSDDIEDNIERLADIVQFMK